MATILAAVIASFVISGHHCALDHSLVRVDCDQRPAAVRDLGGDQAATKLELGRGLIQIHSITTETRASAAIVSGQAVVSCCQASPVLETAEEAFDKVATPIYGAIERVRNCSRCGGWNNSLDATGFEPVTQAVRVISFICHQVFRRGDGTQQRHGHADVGNVAGRQREGNRPAAIIGQTMDFRGATAARAPDRLRPLPPFAPAAERCAFTCELSRLSSRGTSPEAAICSNRRCQSPRCDHLL